MTKLHVVSVTVGAVDQDQDQDQDQASSRVVGAYTNVDVANRVKQVTWGNDPVVTEVEVDFIDPDLLAAMRELGIKG